MRIGIDLGGTKIEGLLLAPDGRELARRRIATPRNDYGATLAAIAGLVSALEADSGAEPAGGGAASVGLAIPGALSPASGLVKNANSTWINDRPFDRDLAAALGRPVRLANDANCFALSEAVDGAAAGAATVFGVILGTGVGGAFVIEQRLLVGRHAITGEWGHNPLPWPGDEERPGPACFCGKSGCIETFLSGPGLARDYASHGGAPGLEATGIAARAAAGEAAAEDALVRYESRLARALAHVVNILDPEVVVLGGGLSRLARLYRSVPLLLPDWVFSDRVTTPVVPPRHGDSSGVRGAAWLWEGGDTATTRRASRRAAASSN
ncbi:MAG: ROK family protein [Kiloniellales bacterium]